MRRISLYSDGGLVGKNPSREAGTYAWVSVRNINGAQVMEDRSSGYVAYEWSHIAAPITNNVMELYAALDAIRRYAGYSIDLYTDSNIARRWLRKRRIPGHLPPWIAHEFKVTMSKFWGHPSSRLVVNWVAGHPSRRDLAAGCKSNGVPVSQWNDLCDRMCREEVKRYREMVASKL